MMQGVLPFLSLKDTLRPVMSDLREAATRVIESGVYINGPETAAFAGELSETLGLGTVVPVSNGLDAIRLIIRGYIELGLLKEGDEVIIPANTYIASLLPVTEFGLKAVLTEPDLRTYGLDWEAAEKALTEKTKAVMTVHLYGTPSWDFERAERFRERGILLIEDNAQAIGASVADPRDGKTHFTGALGDAAAFSFYPTKNIGALGDAGAVATADDRLAATVKALANYGAAERYHNKYAGFNCRMDELQAAMLRVNLTQLSGISERRERNANLYHAMIAAESVVKPEFIPDMRQVWHQYVIRTPQRDRLRETLAREGITTDIHYPIALADQECYRGDREAIRISDYTYKLSKTLAEEVLSLPVANVSEEDIRRVSEAINRFQ